MSTVGRRLLSSLVLNGKVDDLLKLRLQPQFFKGNEEELYVFIQQHVQAHGKLPHPSTIEQKLGDVLTPAPEPPGYYLQEVEKRFLHTRLKEAVLSIQDNLKDEDPDTAFATMVDVIGAVYEAKQRHQVFDFRNAADDILAEYKKKHSPLGETGVMFGWPTIDNQSSGMLPGDFWTFVGRPTAGKTFFLLHGALNGWKKQKQVPGFFSLEMNSLIIKQRLAAMDTKQSLTRIMKGVLSTKAFKFMMDKLTENKDADRPFWVIDSNLAHTPDDIVMLCRQLGITSAWIDAAYLLRSKNNKLGKFERIADNAELLKQRVAGDLGIPVAASYQLLRSPKKKDKADDVKPTMDDVFGGDAMAQLSTGMLGLLQADSIETQKRRHVEILKGRNGEVGGFDVNWDFMNMGFEEIVEPDKADLQFID